MKNKFVHLDWDSGFFGYKVASVRPDHMEPEELDTIIKELKKNDYTIAYCFVNPEDIKTIDTLKNVNAFLADSKVTFYKKLHGENLISGNIKHYPHSFVTSKLKSLALQSGLYSRFKIDPGFINNEFERLYYSWIEKSVSGEIAGKVLVYDENDDEKGFITVSIKGNTGSIGLIAVDTEERGKSIGKNLVLSAFQYFMDNGAETVDVVTQMNNKSACEFYKALSFYVKNVVNVYHLWIK